MAFLDITKSMAPDFRLPSDLAARLGGPLKTIGISQVTSTCVGAIRLATLRDQSTIPLPDLPDLYEPLILFYERGGEFVRDNAGYLDLNGVSIRPLSLQDNLTSPPFQTSCHQMLDDLDRIR